MGTKQVFLAGSGLLLACIFWMVFGFPIPVSWFWFLVYLSLGTLAGFLLRALRRKIFFGKRLSLHDALAIDAIFQGSIILNPQLSYPGVEAEFMARELSCPVQEVYPWFQVRNISAVVIPGLWIAITLKQSPIAVLDIIGNAILVLSLGWMIFAGYRLGYAHGIAGLRYVLSTYMGMCASFIEGCCFILAGIHLFIETVPSYFLPCLYLVVLATFELSPIPFSLGILEATSALCLMIPGAGEAGLSLPFAYRIIRSVPLVLMTLFYLPRYKMRVSDLYAEKLAEALALHRKRNDLFKESQPSEGPHLSIVIPAFNERERLPGFLPDVLDLAASKANDVEILIVDDGSTDGTGSYCEEIANKHSSLRVIKLEKNLGKGSAVRQGMLSAKGRYILFADADGATPIREIDKLLQQAQQGYEVVIGSRTLQEKGIDRERSFIRGLMGMIFYRVTNLLAVPHITDTQCGFKLFGREAARRIFSHSQENGWAFDVEVLYLAQKFGYPICEVPVNWTAIGGSKIHPLRDALKMLLAILRIRKKMAGIAGEN